MIRVVDPKPWNRVWRGSCAHCKAIIECNDEDVYSVEGPAYFLNKPCPSCGATVIEMCPSRREEER